MPKDKSLRGVSELKDKSLSDHTHDRETMAQIFERRVWEARLLPKLASTDCGNAAMLTVADEEVVPTVVAPTHSEALMEPTGRRASQSSSPVHRLLQLPQLLQPPQPQLRPSRPRPPRHQEVGVVGGSRRDAK